MKARHLAVPLIFLCVACSDKSSEAPVETAAQVEAPAASTVAATPPVVEGDLYSRLPDATLLFDFTFTLRSDKLVTGDDGAVRRGISIQYVPPPGIDIQQSVDASLAAAGYDPTTEWQSNQNGGASRTFAKAESPPLTLTVVPDASSSSAGGVIWIGWPVKSGATAG